MKRLCIFFILISFLSYGQNNVYPTTGSVKIFAGNEAWGEGLSIVKPSGWSGIRFTRNDPSGGNYNGNWGLGYTTSNDFSISTNYNGTQYDGIFHITNSTRNVGIGTSSPNSKLVISDGNSAISVAPGNVNSLGFNRNAYDGAIFNSSISAWQFSARDDRFTLEGYNGPSHDLFTVLKNGNIGIGILNPGSSLAIKGAQSVEETVLNITNLSDQDFQVKLSGIGAGVKRTIIGPSTSNRFSLGVNLNEHLTIVNGGNIGIGTTNPDQKLTVNGTIHSKEVKIDLNVPGPDYVFANNYPLPTLNEIKAYIDQNKHLPEVPSAKEMEANGVNVGEMNMILLKKVEELTMYAIEANKKIEAQQKQIEIILESLNKK